MIQDPSTIFVVQIAWETLYPQSSWMVKTIQIGDHVVINTLKSKTKFGFGW